MELQVRDDFSMQLAEMEKIQSICAALMKTKHYASLGEAGIHSIIARAKALGIHPFEALNGGFTCINGKVGMSTEMMAALARRRGHSIVKDPKSNAEICILHGKRVDNGDEWTCTFSKNDALAAGLWNGATWKKYPAIMLYNRCMSMLFRQLFPDLSLGAGYVEDELREITKTGEYAPKDKTIDCEVEDVAPEPEKALISCVSLEQAQELRSLYVSANEETSKRIDHILSVKNCQLDTLPESGYGFIKDILLKGQITNPNQEQKSE